MGGEDSTTSTNSANTDTNNTANANLNTSNGSAGNKGSTTKPTNISHVTMDDIITKADDLVIDAQVGGFLPKATKGGPAGQDKTDA